MPLVLEIDDNIPAWMHSVQVSGTRFWGKTFRNEWLGRMGRVPNMRDDEIWNSDRFDDELGCRVADVGTLELLLCCAEPYEWRGIPQLQPHPLTLLPAWVCAVVYPPGPGAVDGARLVSWTELGITERVSCRMGLLFCSCFFL